MSFNKEDRAAEMKQKVGRLLPGVRHANRRSVWADPGERERNGIAIQCQGLRNGLKSWNHSLKFSVSLSQAENGIDYKKKKK